MKSFRGAIAALAVFLVSALVPVGASPAAAQPAASGGVVVIANGWSPPDVGAAAPLAGRLDAVVLYSSSGSLGSPTVTALKRLRPTRVVLMGGPAALNESVANEVRSEVSGVDLQRLSGADRIDTAARAALVDPAVPAGRPVVIANGWSPPDVGAAAPLADSLGGSVLFSQKNALGDATVDALRRLQPSRVVIVGGIAALDAAIETQIDSAVPGTPTQRLGGVDRTDTAGRGAELANVDAGSPVVIANGWSSHDVGAAAPLAAAIDGTVLFSYRTSLGKYTVAELMRLAPTQVTLVGDADAVPAAVQAEVAELLPSATIQRIAGSDRRATAANAALYATGDTSVLVTDDKTADGEVTTSIAAGQNHTCWLRPNGTIACRGDDRFGRTDPPAGKFTEISAAQTHNCGVRADRTIVCWGAEVSSLDDVGVNTGQADPPSGTFAAVSVGQFHSCGLRTDKTIACWGSDHEDYESNHGQSAAPAGRFTSVDSGDFHACGVRTTKEVVCWGANESGQISSPDGAFTVVAAGGHHTCGIREDNTVTCWGDDELNQLAVPKGSFSSLTAGRHFTCGLRTNGKVKCWGYNGDGQTDALGGYFQAIEAGLFHACGVRIDEQAVDCWGSRARLTGPGEDSVGKFSVVQSSSLASCGILEEKSNIVCWGSPEFVGREIRSDLTDGVPQGSFRDLQVEGQEACGLRNNGEIACWGRHHFATNAQGDYVNTGGIENFATGTYRAFDLGLHGGGSHPVVCGIRHDGALSCDVRNLSVEFYFSNKRHVPEGSYRYVVITRWFACALRSNRTVTCWRFDPDEPGGYRALTPPSGTFETIEGSGHHNRICGISEERELSCWTFDAEGLLKSLEFPVDQTVRTIGFPVSGNFACALAMDQSVHCWRWETHADGTTSLAADLTVVGDQFESISVGQSFGCGLRVDRTIRCLGENHYGQTNAPEGEFVAIAAGTWHACGLRKVSGVVCWGRHAQIVLVDEPDLAIPAADEADSTGILSSFGGSACWLQQDGTASCWPPLIWASAFADRLQGSFAAIAATHTHVCGLRSNGSLECHGTNDRGQLDAPQGTYVAVDVGASHTCALRTDRSIACWGNNSSGQSDVPAGTYQAVEAANGFSCGIRTNGTVNCWGAYATNTPPGSFTAISGGNWHACGLTTAGHARCWGDNRDGQLNVPQGESFAAVTAGGSHACGLRTNGTVVCWGANNLGQLDVPDDEVFIAIAAGGSHTCGMREDRSVTCW